MKQKAPKCCKQGMELKATMVVPSDTGGNNLFLFFQCKKCKKIDCEDDNT